MGSACIISYQVSRRQIEPLLRYSSLTVIKMATVRRLEFLGIQIFN